jgi:hypothetical protein
MNAIQPKCRICEGSGKYYLMVYDGGHERRECPECGGTGQIKKEHGAQDARAVCSKELLDILIDRFLKHSSMSYDEIQKATLELRYRDAYEASLRRDFWLYAAEMVKQEKLSNIRS